MNIVRFNEPFEAAIKAWPREVEGMELMPFTNWQRTPLFQYFTTREKEKGMVGSLVGSGNRLEASDWPFDTFRLSVSQHAPGGWEEDGRKCGEGMYRVDMIVTRKMERIYILANIIQLYDETPETKAASRRYNPLICYMADCYTKADNPETYTYRANTFAGGRWINSKLGGNLTMGVMDTFAGFIIDSMVPSNHIAMVRPDEPTKSVEWVKARTHYTLITHGHPANKRHVPHGARVASDPDKELRRMAHDRKGHYKQLKHPRYKYALAEKRYPDMPPGTIYVKPAWIGPKEWRSEGGHQIYKILEPIAAAEAA
jgi:hypothetical protein